MRSKTPLALMEQVVMVLVFALAAALCLQVFAFSNRVSKENKDIDRAVLLAQNTAEMLKACSGIEEAAEAAGGELRQTVWISYYDAELNLVPNQADACYEVNTFPQSSGVEGLDQAGVSVFRHGSSEALFSLTAAWQEVSGNG